MDNTAIDYKDGWRAYYDSSGRKFFQDTVYGKIEYAWANKSHDDWHALRAYQDAERKKGAKIEDFGPEWESRDYDYEDEKGWTSNIFHALGWGYEPIHQYYCDIPCAMFTNFRWRAGYPKGGQNG